MATAAVIAGGSILGAVSSRNASKRAAKAQQRGVDAATAEQRRQFDITQQNLQPFQQAGQAAVGSQQDLLGLNGPEAQAAAFAALEQSPGQQFLRDRAQKNLLRNASAIGGLGGGNVRSALVQQGVGFAQQDLQNQFNRLGQLAGQGQGAATSIGQFGQNTAGNIANLNLQAGGIKASGIAQRNQILQQGLGGLFSAVGQSGILGGGGQFGGGTPFGNAANSRLDALSQRVGSL
jgi:hypothetical protein